MAEDIIKIPPAKSLIQGLRCIGYNFSTAIADIIDNSISANASHIYVDSDPGDNGKGAYVSIFDDGCGMGRKALENAMTLGSDREDKEDSETELGRFGLGLKSASFSQCVTLIVASKDCNKINAMSYDLDEIQRENQWLLKCLNVDEINALPEINQLKESQSGTLVIWENFDKILAGAKSFNDSFVDTIEQAKKHVEFVFHRFYDKIDIEFNGHRVEKRDPFLENLPGTQKGRTQSINVDDSTIEVTPFVLPYLNSLTEEHKRMLGNPKSIYDDQGFYIYRNKRLIIWGSWLHMNIRSEFNKLARVRVDVPSSLDSLWMLDVKKSSAKIPDKIKEQLQIAIKDSITRSKREIKYPGKKEAEANEPIWRRVDLHNGVVKYELNREDNPLYRSLISGLDDRSLQLLTFYLKQVEELIPKALILSDNADSLHIQNSTDELKGEDLIEQVLFIAEKANNPELMVDMLLNSQGYSKLQNRKKEIYGRLKNGKIS